ncbi:MAG TPA: DUF1858 domain-containing protein [Clostridia bacterium]|nr:DUF1858 domain-containing protein [Clostridia bacterium]
MSNEKVVDLSKSVYALCSESPEIIEIMADLGFKDITKPGMLATAGRFMTIPKGAAIKKLDIGTIEKEFSARGFTMKKEV